MSTWRQVLYKYKYLHLKYKYEYKYFKTVLEYNLSRITSTNYSENSGQP